MKRLLDLSLRHKLPLWGGGLILVATLAVSVGAVLRAFDDLEHDLVTSSQSLGRTLAKPLFSAMLHDDTWRAIELIEAPLHASEASDPLRPQSIFLVSPDMRVLVSSTPRSMPLASDLGEMDAVHEQLAAALRRADLSVPRTYQFPGSDLLFVATVVGEEGARIGTLVITHDKQAFLARFTGIALRGAAMGALVLMVLLPLNWYWGRRMAQPLVQLARGMAKLVQGTPHQLNPDLYAFDDEVGQLYSAYREAAAEISRKAALEQEVMQSERLAAVGRLAAGIAHEVNNPLAGMLIALDNLKQRQRDEAELDPRVARTIDFIQRGLNHVSETVAALLVQARIQSRSLSRLDFEDLHTLIEPQVSRKGVRLAWSATVADTLNLPASLVRQVLINLLLNAVQATPSGGEVRLDVTQDDKGLTACVRNDGEPPPPEVLAHIFEPFVSGREGGNGLGLWVAYQTVCQLGGHIGVECQERTVLFRVQLPLKETAA